MTYDQRDMTKEPPAELNPRWVLKMQAAVKDAAKGSKPWPYGMEKEWVHVRGDWLPA